MFHAIWLGLTPEALNRYNLFGKAGGVSFLLEEDDGKHCIQRFGDLSYLIERKWEN